MRDKIRNVSIQLFDEKGYSETSIQDIVEALGVTKGTFYYYYKSKQELLTQIHLTYIENLLDEQEKILQDEKKTYKEKLYNNILLVIKSIRPERQSARIFMREMRHLKKGNLEMIKEKRDAFRINTQTIIEKGIEAGEFTSEMRPNLVTFGILGLTNWSYYWFQPDGEVSEEELASEYMQFILHGISNKT